MTHTMERLRFFSVPTDNRPDGNIKHTTAFLYNKTNQMHQFPKFTLAWNSTCFGQFVCPASEVYSLYTRHWYMSYRFVDSFRAGSGWNCSSILVLFESLLAATASGSSKQVWHVPDVVCTVSSSWWWAEKPPETCGALTVIKNIV